MADEQTSFTNESAGSDKPPYCSFVTLSNFIKILHDTHLPSRIDTSLMRNLAGGVQSQLMLAMRFLGLIGSAGEVLQPLKDLVSAYGTPDWKAVLGAVSGEYHKVLPDVNTDTATVKELQDSFAKYGNVTGSTQDKAIRFYLKMLDEANLTYSAHFKRIRKSSGNGNTRPRKKKAGTATPPGATTSSHAPKATPKVPEGMMDFPLRLPGREDGTLIVPRDIRSYEVTLIQKQIEYLAEYAKQMTENQ